MSLRVLLADESDTIKKVFQLALQDMNADIKNVQSGLDVVNVAQSFKPQIIFADVLLQKRNGYDTCLEIKQNPQLANIPVVLMWSSFMELDQEQYKKSKANDQLEKPFDADFLREMVKRFVPEAANNPLAQFLKFPKSIKENTTVQKTAKSAPAPAAPKESPIKEDTSEFNLGAILGDLGTSNTSTSASDLFDNLTSTSFQIPNLDKTEQAEEDSLDKFKLDLKNDNLDKFESLNLSSDREKSSNDDSDVLELPEIDNIQPTKITDIFPQESFLEKEQSISRVNMPNLALSSEPLDDELAPSPPIFTPKSKKVATTGLNDQEIEAIVRAHTEEIIKTQVQNNLTSIVEKIVREELNKLLTEEVRLKQDLNDDNP